MNTLKKIFTKKAPAKRSPVEVREEIPVIEITETPTPRGLGEIEPILIKSMDLQSVIDVQDIANELQDGNVVIVDITPMLDEDPAELKRAVDQLKGISQGIGGDVGRLSESKIIATPKFVRIQFKKPA
jgi:SepF-like predicted cell division protein (DUF552 family)